MPDDPPAPDFDDHRARTGGNREPSPRQPRSPPRRADSTAANRKADSAIQTAAVHFGCCGDNTATARRTPVS
jgi:hypothetical protein